MPRDTAHAAALALSVGVCHKGCVMLRDFASINAYFSEREIDELQAAIDARGADVAARTEARRARVQRCRGNPQYWPLIR